MLANLDSYNMTSVCTSLNRAHPTHLTSKLFTLRKVIFHSPEETVYNDIQQKPTGTRLLLLAVTAQHFCVGN